MSTSTVNSRITTALEAGLQAAKIDHANISSAADQIKLCKWLNAWITNGTDGLITDRIGAAKALFTAKEGQATDGHIQEIQGKLEAMESSFNALFEGMTSSSRGVLGVIPGAQLDLIKLSLESNNIKGSRTEPESPQLTKQMNMLMHQLIDQSKEHAIHSEHQGKAFKEKLAELLEHNADSFTPGFLTQFQATIVERQKEVALDERIYSRKDDEVNPAERLSESMRLMKMTKDNKPVITITDTTQSLHDNYEAWNKLETKVKAEARTEGELFFARVSNGQLHGLTEADKAAAIQSEIQKLSPNAKLFVQIKTKEHEIAINLQKHETNLKELFGKIFGEGFFSKALVTAVMGFFGGSIFGSPILGVLLTSMVSLLGGLNDNEVPKLAPPEPANSSRASRTNSKEMSA